MKRKIYTITVVSTEPFINGRCSRTHTGFNPKELIEEAYEDYLNAFSQSRDAGILYNKKETPLDEDLFARIMRSGFSGCDDLAIIRCETSHIEYEGSSQEISVAMLLSLLTGRKSEAPEKMTNREYLALTIAAPNWIDDGGASYDSWLHYNVNCPYLGDDERGHCHNQSYEYVGWDNCNACKEEWLEMEVDE